MERRLSSVSKYLCYEAFVNNETSNYTNCMFLPQWLKGEIKQNPNLETLRSVIFLFFDLIGIKDLPSCTSGTQTHRSLLNTTNATFSD